MKTVVLADGFSIHINEKTHLKPKPMVKIGRILILWHVMEVYLAYDINEFGICCGYKCYLIIKEYFATYFLHTPDITLDIRRNKMEAYKKYSEPWKIILGYLM